MATLVDQIMMQSQAGSANGAGLGDFLAKGTDLAQSGRQLRMQEDMAPLQRQLMEQTISFNNQMNSLKIQEAIANQKKLLAMTAVSTEASQLVADFMADSSLATDPNFLARAKKVLSNSYALATDPGQTLFKMLSSSAALSSADTGENEIESQEIDTLTGKVKVVPKAKAFVPDPNKAYALTVTVDDRGRAKRVYKELTDTEVQKATEEQKRAWGWVPLREGEKGNVIWGLPSGGVNIELDENGKVRNMTIGGRSKGGSDLPTAVESKVAQAEIAGDVTLDSARRFGELLSDPSLVGFPGAISRLKEGLGPLVGMKPGTRATELATIATQFMAAAVQANKSDAQIAEAERKMLTRDAPDPRNFFGSPATEMTKLTTWLRRSGEFSREGSKRTGKINPRWLTPKELESHYLNGTGPFEGLSDEAAKARAAELGQINGWKIIQYLQSLTF